MIKLLLCLSLALYSLQASAQDFQWWNAKHNWNGTQHWREFLILSPKYMGPNALPVTPLRTGRISEHTELELGATGHFSDGDKTQDLSTRLYVPVLKGMAGLEVNWVGIEHFKNDTLTRDERRSREFDGEGISVGDVWVTAFFTLFRESESKPDMLLAINLKTASGNNLHAARFTDAPGYSFDLSVGKKMQRADGARYFRPMAMAGFYAWQTFSVDENQDDAFLYGVGTEWGGGRAFIRLGLRGYVGYRNNGDRPMISSLVLGSAGKGQNRLKIDLQMGIFDYPYASASIGIVHKFGHPEGVNQ